MIPSLSYRWVCLFSFPTSPTLPPPLPRTEQIKGFSLCRDGGFSGPYSHSCSGGSPSLRPPRRLSSLSGPCPQKESPSSVTEAESGERDEDLIGSIRRKQECYEFAARPPSSSSSSPSPSSSPVPKKKVQSVSSERTNKPKLSPVVRPLDRRGVTSENLRVK